MYGFNPLVKQGWGGEVSLHYLHVEMKLLSDRSKHRRLSRFCVYACGNLTTRCDYVTIRSSLLNESTCTFSIPTGILINGRQV